MTNVDFTNLKPGDKVRYNGETVVVSTWLEKYRMVEYTNGTNTKLSDPWLSKMVVIPV